MTQAELSEPIDRHRVGVEHVHVLEVERPERVPLAPFSGNIGKTCLSASCVKRPVIFLWISSFVIPLASLLTGYSELLRDLVVGWLVLVCGYLVV